MATDEEYMDFLDKANQDPSEGTAKSQSSSKKKEFKATDQGVQPPAPLVKIAKDAFYTSDADEPFVPVALNWDASGKDLPDEGTFPSTDSQPAFQRRLQKQQNRTITKADTNYTSLDLRGVCAAD